MWVEKLGVGIFWDKIKCWEFCSIENFEVEIADQEILGRN
jgi:hypothetical protein